MQRKRPMDSITETEVMDAIDKANCNLSLAAKLLGVHYNTLFWHIKKNDNLSKYLETMRNQLADDAEQQLVSMVRDGNFPAVKLMLEALARERGYGTQRVEQKIEGDLKITDTALDDFLKKLDDSEEE